MGKKILIKEATEYETSIQPYFEEFNIENSARLSEKSVIFYQQTYKKFTDWFEAREGRELLAGDLSDSIVYAYINGLKRQMLKPASINSYLKGIRTFFNWLYNNSYIEQPIKIRLIAAQEEEFKCYSVEEQELLIEKPKPKDSFVTWRSWTIINWGLATGNRAATIRDVRVGDIDFKRKEIKLHHTKNKKLSVPIPLSRELNYVLKEYIKKFRSGADKDDFLFCDVSGEKLSESGLASSIKRYNKSRGVSNTSIHSLRHTFARQWLINSGNMFTLQKILGHSTLDQTRRYTNIVSADLRRDFEDYNALDTIKKDRRHKIKAMD